MRKIFFLTSIVLIIGAYVNVTAQTTTTTSVLADCLIVISVSPSEGGTTSPPPPQYISWGCYPVTVEAIPNPGYTFSHWEGAIQSSDNPIEISGGSITAVFIPEGTASIPTLSEWGIVICMSIIMGIGVVMLLRRKMV
jgi:hypothetical protein